jgi:hypothetical protein
MNIFFLLLFLSGITVVNFVLQRTAEKNHKEKTWVNVLAKYHC